MGSGAVTPTRAAGGDLPKKKSILKKDAISKEETEPLFHDSFSREIHENGEDTSDTISTSPLLEEFQSPVHKPKAKADKSPPKIAPPPKSMGPLTRVGLKMAPRATVETLSPMSPLSTPPGAKSLNNHEFPPHAQNSNHSDEQPASPEVADNIKNSGAAAGDDAQIAYMDDSTPTENTK